MANEPRLTVSLGVLGGYTGCLLRDGEQRLRFQGSHLRDSFRQLIETVTAVLNGQPEGEAEFDFEPVYYRWVVERTGLAVRCLVVEGCEYRGTDRLLFRSTVPLSDFGHIILIAFADLRNRVTPPQYQQNLHGLVFPDEPLEELRAVVERSAG